VSRTGIIMLLVVGAVFFWLRRAETKRFLPLLLPALVVVQIALPGTLGALQSAFFPEGGIVASEQQGSNTGGSGRLADVGPTLSEWSQRPLVGQGYGTRVVSGEEPNARILDDQWLASLLETGILGVAGWFWLFRRSVRRLARAAKTDASPRGWLFTALAASILAFAVGMLTFDAFSFTQGTVLLFVLLAFGTVALRQAPESSPVRSARVTRREVRVA
jgi:O-antigen ligase